MEALGNLATGFGVILTPQNLYFCFLGSLIGTLVGVLPGLGPLAAMALLLPVTFTLTPVAGMVMLASIFYGAMYGGSTTSVLLNIPGEAASVVTCIDGHQMARQGRAGAALGIAAIGSFLAGTVGIIVMTFCDGSPRCRSGTRPLRPTSRLRRTRSTTTSLPARFPNPVRSCSLQSVESSSWAQRSDFVPRPVVEDLFAWRAN